MRDIAKILNSATMGKPDKVKPAIYWTLLEYLLKGTPISAALLIIWEVFKPLENPQLTLNTTKIIFILLILFITLFITLFVSRKAYLASFIQGYDVCQQGRLDIANHLRKLPMGFYNSRDPGDIGSYLVADYGNIEMLLTHLMPRFIGALVMPFIAIVTLFFFDWRLALAAAIVIPLSYPLVLVTNYLVRKLGIELQKTKVNVASRMIEYIHGIRLIKAFNLTGTRFARLNNSFHRLKQQAIKVEAAPAPTIILANVFLNGGLIFIMLLGMSMLLDANITIATYVMFLIVAMVIYLPLMEALTYLADINYMKLSVDRIEQLRLTPTLSEGNLEQFNKHQIEFKNISFSYHQKIPVIRNLSLVIPEHSLTAFIGPSGSGKTTLTRLIARFWDVDQGEILIGGHNIKNYNIDSLMSQISIVFQDVYLFKDTILNNIRIGREEATEQEIIEAAKTAHCHEFITALPKGYQTMVGEGGNSLSGGEKQRISIARAIIKNAPIILLDEATASLDPENELYIQKAINELVKNKTVIIIAHRLNTVIKADNIVVIDQGKLVEQGKHSELLAKNGLYAELWQQQQQTKGWKF